ncbi:hypothetical protein BJ508DRAFT_216778 [Ascobolus immersus RN42]|uniref:Mediator of RNA polymerase II transcription subunit 18 n=1 Tax=Ascobolus immersus RN42 TaxID=1160509 RepID=A0A3N4HIE0_ASCIM|nr:hypothetical protein BJ508DRAFT_216778 [Ascobolus immersus RN42]
MAGVIPRRFQGPSLASPSPQTKATSTNIHVHVHIASPLTIIITKKTPKGIITTTRISNDPNKPHDPRAQHGSHTRPTMQELSLFAAVPHSRVPQVLRILSTWTQMKPQPILTHHLIYKPKRPRPPVGTVTNAQEMYHLQLVSTIDDEEEVKKEEDVKHDDYVNRQKWTLRFTDIPEGGRRNVTSRSVMMAEVEEGDVLAFMDALGYVFVSSYLTSGHTLIHNDLTLSLTELLLPPMGTSPHNCDPFPLTKHNRLEPSGTHVLQASVNVAKNSDVDCLTAGSKSLEDFARKVRGIVELEPGDRLGLDTRSKEFAS